jgi:NAD(P)-dependent dehydrogenase (short-subunit alcohol dehydrogenase family)
MSEDGTPRFDFPGAFGLSGEVAVITGGSRGIGRAITHGLAAAGADVAPVSRTETDVERVADELGRPSVVVNNAGINPDAGLGTPDRVDAEGFDVVNDVNLRGASSLTPPRSIWRRPGGRW